MCLLNLYPYVLGQVKMVSKNSIYSVEASAFRTKYAYKFSFEVLKIYIYMKFVFISAHFT